jgi:mannose-6-phosphate isomerase-like protein (cupin superfamily)
MKYEPINLKDKLSRFTEHWSPKIVAQLNNYHFKLAKGEGDFVWHKHDDTDEVFLLIEGELTIHFRDGSVLLKPGEMFVVPKGLEHKPSFGVESSVLIIEPAGTAKAGDTDDDIAATEEVWI